jgi:hypothetical protein
MNFDFDDNMAAIFHFLDGNLNEDYGGNIEKMTEKILLIDNTIKIYNIFFHRYDEYQPDIFGIKNLIVILQHYIKSIKNKNDKFILPYSIGEHAICFHFEKLGENYNITLINSGLGLDRHEKLDDKYNLWLSFLIPNDNIDKFIKDFTSLIVIMDHYKNNIDVIKDEIIINDKNEELEDLYLTNKDKKKIKKIKENIKDIENKYSKFEDNFNKLLYNYKDSNNILDQTEKNKLNNELQIVLNFGTTPEESETPEDRKIVIDATSQPSGNLTNKEYLKIDSSNSPINIVNMYNTNKEIFSKYVKIYKFFNISKYFVTFMKFFYEKNFDKLQILRLDILIDLLKTYGTSTNNFKSRPTFLSIWNSKISDALPYLKIFLERPQFIINENKIFVKAQESGSCTYFSQFWSLFRIKWQSEFTDEELVTYMIDYNKKLYDNFISNIIVSNNVNDQTKYIQYCILLDLCVNKKILDNTYTSKNIIYCNRHFNKFNILESSSKQQKLSSDITTLIDNINCIFNNIKKLSDKERKLIIDNFIYFLNFNEKHKSIMYIEMKNFICYTFLFIMYLNINDDDPTINQLYTIKCSVSIENKIIILDKFNEFHEYLKTNNTSEIIKKLYIGENFDRGKNIKNYNILDIEIKSLKSLSNVYIYFSKPNNFILNAQESKYIYMLSSKCLILDMIRTLDYKFFEHNIINYKIFLTTFHMVCYNFWDNINTFLDNFKIIIIKMIETSINYEPVKYFLPVNYAISDFSHGEINFDNSNDLQRMKETCSLLSYIVPHVIFINLIPYQIITNNITIELSELSDILFNDLKIILKKDISPLEKYNEIKSINFTKYKFNIIPKSLLKKITVINDKTICYENINYTICNDTEKVLPIYNSFICNNNKNIIAKNADTILIMNSLNDDIELINFSDDYLIIKLELNSNKTVKNIYINNNSEPVIFNLDYNKYLFLNFSPLLTTNYIIKKDNKFKLLIISLNDWNSDAYLFGKKPDKKYIIELDIGNGSIPLFNNINTKILPYLYNNFGCYNYNLIQKMFNFNIREGQYFYHKFDSIIYTNQPNITENKSIKKIKKDIKNNLESLYNLIYEYLLMTLSESKTEITNEHFLTKNKICYFKCTANFEQIKQYSNETLKHFNSHLDECIKHIKYDCIYTDGILSWIKYNLDVLHSMLKCNIILNNLYKMKKIFDKKCDSKIICQELFEIFDLEIFTSYNNDYRIFEIISGLIINADQNEKITEIFQSFEKKTKNIFHFMMGKGKSSVITPYLLINLFNEPDINKIYVIIPSHLINQTNKTLFLYQYLYKIQNLNIISDTDAKIILINNKFNNKDIFIFDEFDMMYNPNQSNFNQIIESTNECISNLPIDDIFKMVSAFNEDDYKDKDYYNKLWFIEVKQYINDTSQIKNLTYGMSYKNVKKRYVIPYARQDTPMEQSNFKSILLSLVLTIKYFIINNYNFEANDYILFKNDNIYDDDTIDQYYAMDKYMYLNKIKSYHEKLEETIKKEIILKYIKTYIIPDLKVSTKINNCSFIDLMNYDNIWSVGYSGTVYIPIMEDKYKFDMNIKKDDEEEINVKAAILGDYENSKNLLFYINNRISENIFNILKDNLHNSLIDICGVLKDYTSLQVVEIISKYPIYSETHFIYLDYNSNKMEYFKGEIKKYNDELYTNIFYYYNQKHIVGIDFIQPTKLLGAVIIDNNSKYTDVAQGIYRLRKLNRGHVINIIYIDEHQELNKNDIYNKIKYNQDTYNNNQCELLAYQNLKYNIRSQLSEDKYMELNIMDLYCRNKDQINNISEINEISKEIIKSNLNPKNISEIQRLINPFIEKYNNKLFNILFNTKSIETQTQNETQNLTLNETQNVTQKLTQNDTQSDENYKLPLIISYHNCLPENINETTKYKLYDHDDIKIFCIDNIFGDKLDRNNNIQIHVTYEQADYDMDNYYILKYELNNYILIDFAQLLQYYNSYPIYNLNGLKLNTINDIINIKLPFFIKLFNRKTITAEEKNQIKLHIEKCESNIIKFLILKQYKKHNIYPKINITIPIINIYNNKFYFDLNYIHLKADECNDIKPEYIEKLNSICSKDSTYITINYNINNINYAIKYFFENSTLPSKLKYLKQKINNKYVLYKQKYIKLKSNKNFYSMLVQ